MSNSLSDLEIHIASGTLIQHEWGPQRFNIPEGKNKTDTSVPDRTHVNDDAVQEVQILGGTRLRVHNGGFNHRVSEGLRAPKPHF